MKKVLLVGMSAAALIAAACAGDDDSAPSTEQPGASPEATGTAPAETSPTPTPAPTFDRDELRLRNLFGSWPNTDPATLTVPASEIIQGCFAGRDCIVALDLPGEVDIPGPGGIATFAPVAEVDYDEQLPIAFVTVNGETHGYPLNVLTFHEVVNDVVGGVPVVATYCPLCNSALAFERTVDGRRLDFGVSGFLRNSDLIMFDRQTESWWQQLVGEGLAGEFAGRTLEPVAMRIISYQDFAASFPDAAILTTDTGFTSLSYTLNPYTLYDAPGTTPFAFRGELDTRLDALERVVALEFGDAALAVPFGALAESAVANVEVGAQAVAVLWAPGTVSVLDNQLVAASRDVGAAVAYDPEVNGQRLTFEPVEDGVFRDVETGSTWDLSGLATGGPLAGTRLAVVQHANHFWFAWAAFFPGTEVWQA